MGGMGLIFTPGLVRHLLGPLGLSGLASTFWLIATSNNPIEKYNPSLAAYLTHPLYTLSVILRLF